MKKVVRRSRDVTFNENAVYKDKLAVDFEFANEQPELEKAVLDDTTKEDLARNSGSSDNVLVTPEAEVRRSSKIMKPPQRFYLYLNFRLVNIGSTLYKSSLILPLI